MEDLGDWSLVRPTAVFVVIVRESKNCPHDPFVPMISNFKGSLPHNLIIVSLLIKISYLFY